jgi:hypothetical protein
MKDSNKISIGIKQIIRLQWLDYILEQIKQGKKSADIRKELSIILALRQNSDVVIEKGNVTKNILISNLCKTWIDKEPDHKILRGKLLKINTSNTIPLHWISISLAYPFWFEVATIIGRLLSLQPSFNHNQLLNRLKEIYGDRETVKRCTRYVLRSMLDWGCISEIERSTGQYGKSDKIYVDNPALISLFLEMVITNFERDQISITEFYTHPSLFPFNLQNISSNELTRNNDSLKSVRLSMHDEVITFKAIA